MNNEEWAYGELSKRMGKAMAREQPERQSERQSENAELAQLRAEVAMLRSQQDRYETYARETERQKKADLEFLAWVALTAEQKTQLKADEKFAGDPGPMWEVQLQEHPKVRLPAMSKFDAIGKYNVLCGILSTEHEHSAEPVSTPPVSPAA
jgi:hypothetical protein